jgi:hypothetical protein
MLALTAVIIIGFVVAKSLYFFNSLETNTDTPHQNTGEVDTPGNNSGDQPIEGINQEVNNRAVAIENEADNLMKSSPSDAHTKYLAAEQAYREAGNMNKVGEMLANAQTAELLAKQRAEQPAE